MNNKGKRFPAHPLERGEPERLIACAGPRDAALITCVYRCGLRVSEALGLDLADLSRRKGGVVLRVRTLKRSDGLIREVALCARAVEILDSWLAKRGTAPGPLFTTRSGSRVQSQHVRRLLRLLAARAGIERRVHPHALRHTFARQLWEEGVDVVTISRALGHSGLGITDRYLKSIGATEVVETMAGREWGDA